MSRWKGLNSVNDGDSTRGSGSEPHLKLVLPKTRRRVKSTSIGSLLLFRRVDMTSPGRRLRGDPIARSRHHVQLVRFKRRTLKALLNNFSSNGRKDDVSVMKHTTMSKSRSPSPAPSSHRPFLLGPNDDGVGKKTSGFTHIRLRLYISHFLSTWNSRMFEFAAFLFLAAVFPGTLLYASIYALTRSFAVFLLSSSIGKLMDGSDRLVTIKHSIGEGCQHCFRSLE